VRVYLVIAIMKTIPALLFFLAVFLRLCAQDGSSNQQSVSFYADAMVNSERAEHRIQAAHEFYHQFKDFLTSTESWRNGFGDLPWITVLTPPDSMIRVITWQVEEEDSYRYYGFIQFAPKAEKAPLELIDSRPLKSEYALHHQDQWYGAIYYGVQPFRTPDNTVAYLLLGFNAYTPRLNQRVADVLTIRDSSVTLGMPVFKENDSTEVKSRIIVEYADAASAIMKFDREKEMLIYDNVIPINTPEGTTLVPDGSYHGFSYQAGTWRFTDKVFDTISEEPPGGRPKQATKRDLFGREIEKKE